MLADVCCVLGSFELDFKVIRRKGTLVSVGNASGAVPPFPPLKLVEKNVKLLRPTYVLYQSSVCVLTVY